MKEIRELIIKDFLQDNHKCASIKLVLEELDIAQLEVVHRRLIEVKSKYGNPCKLISLAEYPDRLSMKTNNPNDFGVDVSSNVYRK